MDNVQFQQLKQVLPDIGFRLTGDDFYCDNLVIYYKQSMKQWRLADHKDMSGIDITHINFPIDDAEVLRIKKICSASHKTK